MSAQNSLDILGFADLDMKLPDAGELSLLGVEVSCTRSEVFLNNPECGRCRWAEVSISHFI